MEDLYVIGIRLLDFTSLQETLLKYIFNFSTTFLIIRYIYFPHHRKKEYFFTFMMFNTLIFFVCLMLNSVKIKMGFAFGLFALFGLLRYRTGSLPLKEMTYLFMVIVIAVVNALMNERISISEIMLFNVITMILTYSLEFFSKESDLNQKVLKYNNMELIRPENYQLLLVELEKLTGYKIEKLEVGEIDLIKGTCEVRIYYS